MLRVSYGIKLCESLCELRRRISEANKFDQQGMEHVGTYLHGIAAWRGNRGYQIVGDEAGRSLGFCSPSLAAISRMMAL